MSEKTTAGRGAVAGQVERPVRPPAPMRAVRLTLKLDADDMRELNYAPVECTGIAFGLSQAR